MTCNRRSTTQRAQLCRDQCSDEVVKAASGGFPSGLWKAMAELGVLALATPDGEGGACELVAAVEALGRAVFPGPLAGSICAAQLLPPREREAVTSGVLVVSVGRPPLLAWAPAAGLFIEIEGRFAYLARPRGAIEPVETLGGEPWGRVAARAHRAARRRPPRARAPRHRAGRLSRRRRNPAGRGRGRARAHAQAVRPRDR